ncbi:MAG: aromatic ring-hydroxylating dioxygenase subunit alpha [Coleofasciculaceae cyanobacterium SM2_3_26]|nr:aromatic ring-hydroxylating dioxygenase subunit alpha [Coleofasciculaceae cyanobacterium SM2_3_26]
MELATSLQGQTIQNYVREVGINPNHWYPLGWANRLKPGKVMPAMVWQRSLAIYRDRDGQVHALENACPHKGVELHKGEVQGSHLVCPYHGWEFDTTGQCIRIPYLPEGQKLPCATARSYPMQERYGILWIFPGDPELATVRQIPSIPEYDDPDWFMVPITGKFHAHFSICNENTMDVFHGYLHKNLQGWFDPILTSLRDTETGVAADYQVSYQGSLASALRINKQGDRITTRIVSVRYDYPHYHSTLEGVSSLHLMRLPVHPTLTRSFSLLFLKLRLPKWFPNSLRSPIAAAVNDLVFMRFLNQDKEMMESEQRTYSANPQRRYVEVNPAVLALQRAIVRQYEEFMQQSSQAVLPHRKKDPQESRPETEVVTSSGADRGS